MAMEWPVNDVDFYKITSGETIEIINSNNIEEEFYNYSVNFNRAAHIITEYVLDNPRISNLDIYFFALAYLYRHSVELILKAIGFQYIVDLSERKDFLNFTKHNLTIIFETIKPFVKVQLNKDMDAYNWLLEYFNDVSVIDKESDSFRYPFGIHVEKVLAYFEEVKEYSIRPVFDEQKRIDLVAFANKMQVSIKLLDDIYKGIFGGDIEYRQYKPIFLEEGGTYYSQSVIGYKYNAEKFYPFVKAYTDCAQYLYKKMKEDKDLKETLFFPMCYLYRNAVELSLKEILFEECSFSIQEALKYMNKKKHKILSLWNKIKAEIIQHADAPQNDNTIENVEKYIIQIHNFDGTSDKFRYPVDKYLNLHFKKQRKFDIDNINDFFDALLSFLDAVDGLMSEHNQWKADMEAEYQSEYDDYSDYDY